MSHEQVRQPFGLWSSPITPISLARGITFSDVAWDQSGALVWREGRSDRGVLVVQPPDGQAPRDLSGDFSVRAQVGYGGGDFCVGAGRIYFAEAVSGRLFMQPLQAGTAHPVTPAFGKAASPCLSPDGHWLMYVHTVEGQDALAIVDADGEAWPAILVKGHDFYMQPAWHSESRQVAFIAWDHPNMPWDGTTLVLGRLEVPANGLPYLAEEVILAGNEEISVYQPEFSPDGRYLAYASDETGWWQLYLHDLQSGQRRQLTTEPAEHGAPAWSQGQRMFAFSPDGQALYFIRNRMGVESLWQVQVNSGETRQIPLGGYTDLGQLAVAPDGKRLAFIASGPVIPARLVVCTLDGEISVQRRSTAEELAPESYSRPEHVTWKGDDGEPVYGVLFLPHNPKYEGSGTPPVLVNIHGGPTGQRGTGFSLAAQFFTSRGYAYLEVNYRGSTGYGRAFRNKLRRNWGVFDVEDAVSGARFLAEQGLVDAGRMVIIGGSAGGYTVLKTLEDHPGFFKAGICLFGVSNLFTLAAETHKFEAHYTDSLVGFLPEDADLYRQRSPVFFVDRIQDPLAVFQGEEDKVVPQAQSDDVVAVLRQRNVPHIYHLYPGEGHGFRKTETIEHYYKAVEKFLHQYVIFA
jgi:dipeptidyl aminopeptidase/acylaminoacyl peptidase